MRNVSDEVVEKVKAQLYIVEPFSENRAVYEITWRNTAEPGSSTLYAGYLKADSRIACRSLAAPIPFPCHAVPLRV